MRRVLAPSPSYIAEYSVRAPALPNDSRILTRWITSIIVGNMPETDAEMAFAFAISHWIQFTPGAGSVATYWMDILWCLEHHY